MQHFNMNGKKSSALLKSLENYLKVLHK